MEIPGVDERIAALRADVTSGSSALAREAAEILRVVAERSVARSAAQLSDALTAVAVRILDAQPTMAALFNLVREVLAALEGTPEGARLRASEAARTFAGRLQAHTAAAGRRTAELLPADGALLTVSASSAVQSAVLEAARIRPREVICLEGRPMNEGRTLAAALAREGVRVTLAVDAAAESLVPRCSALLLGADAIGDAGVANKIGSVAAARAAAHRGLPVYVVADSSKLLPPGFPQHTNDDRPGDEVWEDPGAVQVWNRYFEVVPAELASRVVLEDGAFTIAQLERKRGAVEVPIRLREWAASRA